MKEVVVEKEERRMCEEGVEVRICVEEARGCMDQELVVFGVRGRRGVVSIGLAARARVLRVPNTGGEVAGVEVCMLTTFLFGGDRGRVHLRLVLG